MSPLYFTDIVYITPGKEEIVLQPHFPYPVSHKSNTAFQQAKQLCIIHAGEMKAQFPAALEVFFFYIEPEANTENTPRAVIWAAC
jgi:hypothetical protein